MAVIEEFKKFALRGNVVDMAIGIVIGGAFGKITTSLVNDIIVPPIGMLIGGVSMEDLQWTLKAATESTAAVTMEIGLFLNTILNFFLIAVAMFAVVKSINTYRERSEKKKEAPAPPPATPPRQEVLLEEIRALLRNKD